MELRDILLKMMQENQEAGQPTELKAGTIINNSPLEISINSAMAPLKKEVLYLTEPVIEKKLFGGSPDMVCYENGIQLPVKDGFTFINEGLKVGDEVLLLRVQNGQKFIVLSRIFQS